jgi:DNA (cytosine-5)-methyltransferase 1
LGIQEKELLFIDLFAGAGGLSEGFVQSGFSPVAHVESDEAACFTLKTRTAYHWLKKINQPAIYKDFLLGKISRAELYSHIPKSILDSTINLEISESNLEAIFSRIDELLDIQQVDIIVGGPPCQAYSIAGRSRDMNGMVGDKRNYLFKYYAEFIYKYKPTFFVFENVLGLLSAKDINCENYLDTMIKLFHEKGYKTLHKVLNSSDYGVPQNRKRVILVGSNLPSFENFPEIEKLEKDFTVSDFLNDLPKIKAGSGSMGPMKISPDFHTYLKDIGIRNGNGFITQHISRPNNERDLAIYRIAAELWTAEQKRLNYANLPTNLITHKNTKTFNDRFKVVAGNLPASHTIVAHISKDGHYYIHPDANQNRSLTPREAARIQTFPDSFFFESVSEKTGRTAAFKQIGNAVPVTLAKQIGRSIKKEMEKVGG